MPDVPQRIFAELKSKNEETRVRAAHELYNNVLSVSRGKDIIQNTPQNCVTCLSLYFLEWPTEKFTEFYNAVSQRIA